MSTGDWDWAQCELRAGRSVKRTIVDGHKAWRVLRPRVGTRLLVTDITAINWRPE